LVEIQPYTEDKWVAEADGRALSREEFLDHLRRARHAAERADPRGACCARQLLTAGGVQDVGKVGMRVLPREHRILDFGSRLWIKVLRECGVDRRQPCP